MSPSLSWTCQMDNAERLIESVRDHTILYSKSLIKINAWDSFINCQWGRILFTSTEQAVMEGGWASKLSMLAPYVSISLQIKKSCLFFQFGSVFYFIF